MFVGKVNQIYLDLPPWITQISLDIFNRCFSPPNGAIFFKFEYLLFEYSLYRRKYLKYSMSPVQYSPLLFFPNNRTLTFHNFFFYIFYIRIQFSFWRKISSSYRHRYDASQRCVLEWALSSFEIRIIRSIIHDRSRNFYRSHYPKRSFFFHKVTITHAATEIRALVNAAFAAFTTSPLFHRDISAKFRVPNWFKCFETRWWILESGWCVLPVVGGNFLSPLHVHGCKLQSFTGFTEFEWILSVAVGWWCALLLKEFIFFTGVKGRGGILRTI